MRALPNIINRLTQVLGLGMWLLAGLYKGVLISAVVGLVLKPVVLQVLLLQVLEVFLGMMLLGGLLQLQVLWRMRGQARGDVQLQFVFKVHLRMLVMGLGMGLGLGLALRQWQGLLLGLMLILGLVLKHKHKQGEISKGYMSWLRKVLPEDWYADLVDSHRKWRKQGRSKLWIRLMTTIHLLATLKAYLQIKIENAKFF